jgi:hypothetical protein
MNKRLIIFIVAGILVLAVIGGLLFVAVNKKNQQQQPVASDTLQLKKILDESVIAPIGSLNNSAIWYFNSEGRLFRVNTDGTGLSEFPLPALPGTANLNQALWPQSGSDFIAVSRTGVAEVKNYYNSTLKTYTDLAVNIKSLDWLPDSQRVIYVWQSGDHQHQQLVMASADGTGFTKISDLFWPDLKVLASPDGKTALLYRTNIQDEINKIYSVNLTTGVISTLIDQGKNIGAIWVPGQNKFVFAQSSGATYPRLYLYDPATRQATDLNLSTTLGKIAFDSTGQLIYAAIPKAGNSGDLFIKKDLTSLTQDIYYDPQENINAIGLLMVGNGLYFTNATDQKFYGISK